MIASGRQAEQRLGGLEATVPVCAFSCFGAGIAGIGAARALGHHGLAAEVVEREPAWKHTGAGIHLPGNPARALRALGLEAAVVERGSLITHVMGR